MASSAPATRSTATTGPKVSARPELHVVGDTLEQGGLEEQRPEIGAGSTTGEHRDPLGDGIVDMTRHRLELLRAHQRAHVDVPLEAGSEAHACHPLDQRRHERVVDGVLHVEALDADAQLAGVGEAAADRTLHGSVEIGVGEHDHRVLAAELTRERDEAPPALLGHDASGGGGAGEHDVVDGVDERCAELGAGPGDDPEQVVRETRFEEQVHDGESGERGLRVGFEDDAVPGQQGRDGIADGQRDRVVPRADDADQALGLVVHDGTGQEWKGTLAARRSQEPSRRVGVVAGRDGDVEGLLERAEAGLAGLDLGEVEQFGLPFEHEVVEAQDDLATLGHGTTSPVLLCGPGAPSGRRHIVGDAHRHLADERAVERRVRRPGVPVGHGRDRGGQPLQPGPIDPVGDGPVGPSARAVRPDVDDLSHVDHGLAPSRRATPATTHPSGVAPTTAQGRTHPGTRSPSDGSSTSGVGPGQGRGRARSGAPAEGISAVVAGLSHAWATPTHPRAGGASS